MSWGRNPLPILDGRCTIHIGDVFDRLADLPDECMDCAVFSPPYWGVRDYGTAFWADGDPRCDHRTGPVVKRNALAQPRARRDGDRCIACGARLTDYQIGMEPTLGQHIDVMVEVMRSLRRVLKPTASVWLNYADSYAAQPNGRRAGAVAADDRTFRDKPFSTIGPVRRDDPTAGRLKEKDLCMVPARLALALQDDGWWIRSEIIWGKTNPMPDSVGHQRPSVSYEKIFLLTKSGDADVWQARDTNEISFAPDLSERAELRTRPGVYGARWQRLGAYYDAAAVAPIGAEGKPRLLRNFEPAMPVWPFATVPFAEAHYATFPPELAQRCIQAGCPPGGRVIDPFGGAGTTALVALRLGRRCDLIELNPASAELARKRLERDWMGEDELQRTLAAEKAAASPVDPGPLFQPREAAE